jgi:hypothetical protein
MTVRWLRVRQLCASLVAHALHCIAVFGKASGLHGALEVSGPNW